MLALVLSIALTPQRPVFPEPVLVQIRIANTSRAPVTVPLAGEKCAYRFMVIDQAASEMLAPKQCRAISGLAPVTIAPGTAFTVSLPLSDFVSIPKPSRYSVQAACRWTSASGSESAALSNTVTLRYRNQGQVTPLASPAIIRGL